MSEEGKAFKVIEIKLIELNLKPGSKLAMLAPESWTPRQIAIFQEYTNQAFKKRGYDFELICFPHGVELFSVSSEVGFK